MTRKEAAEKVAKLRRLARGSKNPHEAEMAREQADKLAARHGLASADLEAGSMGAAFDDLVDQVKTVVAGHASIPAGLFNTEGIINDVLGKIKSIGESDKSARLRQIATLIRTASFFAGDNKVVAEMKAVLDTTLKNHDLTL